MEKKNDERGDMMKEEKRNEKDKDKGLKKRKTDEQIGLADETVSGEKKFMYKNENSNANQEYNVLKFHLPLSEQEQRRFRIFRDCWERGYYITGAAKFGGHFLLYPGFQL